MVSYQSVIWFTCDDVNGWKKTRWPTKRPTHRRGITLDCDDNVLSLYHDFSSCVTRCKDVSTDGGRKAARQICGIMRDIIAWGLSFAYCKSVCNLKMWQIMGSPGSCLFFTNLNVIHEQKLQKTTWNFLFPKIWNCWRKDFPRPREYCWSRIGCAEEPTN